MRGRHYPRQDRMEATARLHDQGQKRSRRPLTEEQIAYADALTRYYADRKEAMANGSKLPSMADYMPAKN